MTKEEIQRVLDLSLEYYKYEVFGTNKESEKPSCERIDWIYDKMKGNSEIPNDWKKAADKEYPYEKGMNEHMLDLNAQKQAAFFKGAKWDRQQMMSEAVEGEVRKDGTIGYFEFSNEQQFHSLLEQFQDCDKVRIIIIKEDEK